LDAFSRYPALKKRYAEIGEVWYFGPDRRAAQAVKKKDVLHGVVVRQRKPFRRKDGSYIRFDDNAVVVLEWGAKDKKEPKAGRIFGPIPRELQELGYQTIISRAPEVV
jgi:large subunit ribosomal protein L14